MTSTVPKGLSFADAATTWEIVSSQLEAFIGAWERCERVPVLAEFLPPGAPAVRRLLVVELVKVDLEYRWVQRRIPKRLEEYAAELPELGPSIPSDLLYEEYHVRKQAGEQVKADEYFARFPDRADELRRLFGLQRADVSTSLFRGTKGVKLAPIELEAGQQLDDFDLLGRLGKGAFATVYLARQRSMQRPVALKVSSRRSDEPQTLARLDHPNIVRVYDQREVADRGLRLLYMEYVPGGTLQEVAERVRSTPPAARTGAMLRATVEKAIAEGPAGAVVIQGRVGSDRLDETPWSEVVCRIGLQLASALAYAHRGNTLHRDIKPANVLLTADGSPKLADFNISYSSKLEGSTPAAFFGGSLAYMSPEQLEACNPKHDRQPEELDGRSDIYSLGVVLWELLTGSRPFGKEEASSDWAATLESMTQRRRHGIDADTLSQLPDDLLPGLREVLARCLEGDLDERFPTAEELTKQLHLCLQPNVQRLMQPSQRSWYRWARRHPLIATASIAMVPNGILSVANVTYDWHMIPAAQRLGLLNLLILKSVLYLVGIVIGVGTLLPVFRGIAGRAAPEQMPYVRRWCLKAADLVFWVSVGAWAISGVLFPAWIVFDRGVVTNRDYFHFIASHNLCGFIAGTLVFFVLTFLTVHVYYPVLIDATSTAGDLENIAALRRRIPYYSRLAVAVPFLALLSLPFVDKDFKIAYFCMVLLAAGVWWLSYRLNSEIRTDLDAITLASTAADKFGATSQGSEFFRGM